MNKNLKEYKLKNGTSIPGNIAIELANIAKRLDTGITKIKLDIEKARNTRDNK